MRFTIALLAICVLTVSVFGSELNVPADYGTIQAGIDAAVAGDVVVVADGVYQGENNRGLNFDGKAITVKSANGAWACVIDCEQRDVGFNFKSGEDNNSIVDGFTIINSGFGSRGGAPVYCLESSPLIRGCVFGPGNICYCDIYCRGTGTEPLKVDNCVFGLAPGSFSKINISDSNLVITNSTICSGVAPIVLDLTVSTVEVSNSVIVGDVSGLVGVMTASYSAISGGWAGVGNIDAEGIVTPDGHLFAGSDAINAGDAGFAGGGFDIDGDGRVFGGRVDIGADEFVDSDGDGLPDWWELKYFSSATAADANGDEDFDGRINIDEYELYSSDPGRGYYLYADVNDGDDSYDGWAAVWDGVSGPKRTVQAAIGAAGTGDVITVAAGTYDESIDFGGKGVTVRSGDPFDSEVVRGTIITAESWSVFYKSSVIFRFGEGRDSVLEGFTVHNGEGMKYPYRNDLLDGRNVGGSVYCEGSSPTIRHCIFTKQERSSVETQCGPIALLGGSSPLILNCLIADNSAMIYCGGILIRVGEGDAEEACAEIQNCTIANNYDARYSFAVNCDSARCLIDSCIIFGVRDEAGLAICDANLVSNSFVESGVIWEGEDIREIYGKERFDFSQVGGNISRGCLFVQPLMNLIDSEGEAIARDYHVLAGSRTINAGDSNLIGEGLFDLDGGARVQGGRVDMGAYEFGSVVRLRESFAGARFVSGSEVKVGWEAWSIGGEVVLEYSGDNGVSWNYIGSAAGDAGEYLWDIPDVLYSRYCKLRVSSVEDANVFAESSAFYVGPFNPDPAVESLWPGLGGGFSRSGSSEIAGPMYGCVKWECEPNEGVVGPVTVGYEDRIHFPSGEGKVVTLSADGDFLWEYDAGGSELYAAATVGLDGSIYIGDSGGKFYALDKDGRVSWVFNAKDGVYSSAAVGESGDIYVCDEAGYVYALSRNGGLKWEYKTGGGIFASPAIGDDGEVYVSGLYDANMYALDADDGSVRWACEFPEFNDVDGYAIRGWPIASPVVGEDGTIYQGLLYDANLYAIEPNDGSIKWACNLNDVEACFFEPFYYGYNMSRYYTTDYFQWQLGGNCWTEPAVGPDGTIYVSLDDYHLRAIDPNGQMKWTCRLGKMGSYKLTVDASGLIYAACDDGTVYLVNPHGVEIGRYCGEGAMNAVVVSGDGCAIFSGAEEGLVKICSDDCEGKKTVFTMPEDIDGDGMVNFRDFAMVVSQWMEEKPGWFDRTGRDEPIHNDGISDLKKDFYSAGDINRDYRVDNWDIGALGYNWLGDVDYFMVRDIPVEFFIVRSGNNIEVAVGDEPVLVELCATPYLFYGDLASSELIVTGPGGSYYDQTHDPDEGHGVYIHFDLYITEIGEYTVRARVVDVLGNVGVSKLVYIHAVEAEVR
jgi:outer membrane protein assembly factor BamB